MPRGRSGDRARRPRRPRTLAAGARAAAAGAAAPTGRRPGHRQRARCRRRAWSARARRARREARVQHGQPEAPRAHRRAAARPSPSAPTRSGGVAPPGQLSRTTVGRRIGSPRRGVEPQARHGQRPRGCVHEIHGWGAEGGAQIPIQAVSGAAVEGARGAVAGLVLEAARGVEASRAPRSPASRSSAESRASTAGCTQASTSYERAAGREHQRGRSGARRPRGCGQLEQRAAGLAVAPERARRRSCARTGRSGRRGSRSRPASARPAITGGRSGCAHAHAGDADLAEAAAAAQVAAAAGRPR